MQWLKAGAACLALVVGTQSALADKKCPCAHKAPGQAYASSSKPISEAHARCLKPIDSYLQWLKDKSASLSDAMDKSLIDGSFDMYLAFDYGVPSREKAEQLLTQAKAEFAEAAEASGALAADFDIESKRAGDGAADGPAHWYDPASLQNDIAKSTGALNVINEDMLQNSAAFVAFSKCVIDQSLPQTTEW